MDFPWEDILRGILPIAGIVIVVMLAPAILGALIGQIGQLFRNIFGGGKDDDDKK